MKFVNRNWWNLLLTFYLNPYFIVLLNDFEQVIFGQRLMQLEKHRYYLRLMTSVTKNYLTYIKSKLIEQGISTNETH